MSAGTESLHVIRPLKLKAAGLQEFPYRFPEDRWINDPTSWPCIEYGDIYTYLIETPGVHTKEYMLWHLCAMQLSNFCQK